MNIRDSFQYLQKKGTKTDRSIVPALVWDGFPALGMKITLNRLRLALYMASSQGCWMSPGIIKSGPGDLIGLNDLIVDYTSLS